MVSSKYISTISKIIYTTMGVAVLFSIVGIGFDRSKVFTTTPTTPKAATAMGPLEVHPTNNRYFVNTSNGKGVYLTGSHNWNVLRQNDEMPGTSYNVDEYLNLMASNNHNFLRLWIDTDSSLNFGGEPMYLRSSVCCAKDGGNKFDLTKFNQGSFNKLNDIVNKAKGKNIYIGAMFFEGWWIAQSDPVDSQNRWDHHPFNPKNNIHSQTSSATKETLHTLSADPFIIERQKAYVKKVIDTIISHDNVIYEIVNEDNSGELAWQELMAKTARDYDATKGKKHPIGITSMRKAGTNTQLFNSSAEWISPEQETNYDYKDNPPQDNKGKVIITDTDHLWGAASDINPNVIRTWVWESFTRGLHPIFMDEYLRADLNKWTKVRRAMGDTRLYADKTGDIANLSPRADLCQKQYCLVDPGNNYIVYSQTSSDFWVNLEAGTYNYEWFDIETNKVTKTGQETVPNGKKTFSPGKAEMVLYLKAGSTPNPTSTPTNQPTPTNVPNPTSTPVPTTPPPSGTTSLTIRAQGTPADGIYPEMSLYIKDVKVKTFNVNNNWAYYYYTHNSSVKASDIKVAFYNDGSNASEDRNLYVDYIKIDGVTYQSEAPSTYSTGTWSSTTKCSPGYKQSQALQCNGYFHYDQGGSNPVPTSTPPPPPAPTQRLRIYEAENATLSGVVVDDAHPGYTGSGFADYINSSNDYVEWTVSVPSSGLYTLNFRYALSWGNRPLQVKVNGSIVKSSLDFPKTGSWSKWGVVTTTASLNSGINKIRATAIGSSGANIDHLEVK